MKTILLILICLTTLVSWTQTAIIAHKSHSGTAADFSTEAFGNFGIPSRKMVQVVYLNDSTTLNVYTRFGNEFEGDTIHSPINYHLNIDSIKKASPYLQEIEYVNFMHSPKSARFFGNNSTSKEEEEVLPTFPFRDHRRWNAFDETFRKIQNC